MTAQQSIDAMFQNVPEKKDDEPPAEVKRDRWGRPVIKQPDGSEIPYIRASTMAGMLDDKTALGDWKARKTGRGVAISPDLQAGFAAIPDIDSKEGKATANELAEQAQERAGSSVKRTLGTAIHSFTETHDKGLPVPHVPPALQTLMANYRRETAGVQWLALEQFCITDEIRTAGTADRIGVRPGQKPRIWDLKTGRVDYGQLKFAVQFAIYAHGKLYNPATGQRADYPDIDLEIGHLIHADPETGEVKVYDVDLVVGWEAAQLARRVYDLRRADVMRPTAPMPHLTAAQAGLAAQAATAAAMQATAGGVSIPQHFVVGLDKDKLTPQQLAAAATASEAEVRSKTVMQQLSACTSLEQLNAVYAANQAEWTERHSKFAEIMIGDIQKRTVVAVPR